MEMSRFFNSSFLAPLILPSIASRLPHRPLCLWGLRFRVQISYYIVMKTLATLVLSVISFCSAFAADDNYLVEYVKSTHGSCVKTDFVPQPGMTFRLDVKFEGPFTQMFGGKFDHTKNTRAIFGCEEAEVDGGRDMFLLELGGNDVQEFQTVTSFGRRGNKQAGQMAQQEINENAIGSRYEITYDGEHLRWGSFMCKLSEERRINCKLPVSFFGMTKDDGTVRSQGCYDMSLYGATFYKDGKQLAAFVPVVKGGVPGLYEKISKKFYASATDVPLTAGPKVEKKASDKAAKKGMKLMIWTGEGNLKDVGDVMTWDNKPTDWSRQKMYDMLDSDDVITHLVLDEPEYRKEADVKEYMAREKSRFPYKPVQMNNCWLGINGRFAGLPTDILMIDYYLTCEGTTVPMVVSKVDVLRSIAPGKPCWYFIDGENSLHNRLPSYKEQIAQCWGSVAAGASGLSWFVNMPTSQCNFDAWKDINREVLEQKDFLLSEELCGGAVVSETTDYIRCLTRKVGNEWRIYTCNVSPHPIAKVAVKLPADIPQDAKVEVVYENRKLEAKGGLFGDKFEAMRVISTAS